MVSFLYLLLFKGRPNVDGRSKWTGPLIMTSEWLKSDILQNWQHKQYGPLKYADAHICNKEGHSALTETRRECHDGIVKIFNQIPRIPLLQSFCNSAIVRCTNKEDLKYLNLPNKLITTLENKAMPTFKG
ncbi:unnamed protein product, partial [Meganyctiphanes norvegica]